MHSLCEVAMNLTEEARRLLTCEELRGEFRRRCMSFARRSGVGACCLCR